MKKIPSIIHLTCRQKDAVGRYDAFIQSMRQWNPDWEIRIYDDHEAREIVAQHFPELTSLYDSYHFAVQRADIFRVIIVYLCGGFYMDTDMFCLRPLDSLRDAALVLGVEKILSQEECRELKHRHAERIANYMFGSVPQHPFWLGFLEAAAGLAHKVVLTENDVLETTGPGLLTNVFHERKLQHDILLLGNDRYKCIKSCCGQPSCHFGDYAAHTHMGSWRWEHKPANPFNVYS
ncbi:glycosyltransferase family 32 protein [Chitinophagaceae bacterium MMS25-I14]